MSAANEKVERIEHPALGGEGGAPLAEAKLSDRGRIGVVLQAAGLLSLCEVAGWRVRGELEAARVDSGGGLIGLQVERGSASIAAPTSLALLLRLLFGGDSVAGRGEGRRAARALLERWNRALDRPSADRAVADLFEAAPFLAEAEFERARAALQGVIVRGGERRSWSAGPSRRETVESGDAAAEQSLVGLVVLRRWRAAVALGRRRPPADADERLAFARALFALGRSEAALALLGDAGGAPATALRAEALLALGELGAAREAVRRLEAGDLPARALLDFGDLVLRTLANSGEPDAARDWVARAVAKARGSERTEARLLGVLAALDRSDPEGATARFEELKEELSAAPAAAVRETELQLALACHDGARAARLAGERLHAERRGLSLVTAGRLWSNLGSARLVTRDFAGAERAYAHASRLLRRCDGPLWLTLAAFNLAEVRLRLGKLRDVESILQRSAAWNRRSGNVRGLVEDELGAIRLELVRGEPDLALDRCRRERARQLELDAEWARDRLAVFEARALGWLGRAAEARAALDGFEDAAAMELEPEELPFLFALAGRTDSALAAAEASGIGALGGLITPLVRGETPAAGRWRALDALEPFRRARFVLDAETMAPGAAPHRRRIEAAALLRRLGATRFADRCARSEAVAWQALGRYFERPSGERAALEELLAAVGHPEAELVARGSDGERRLAGAGGRELPEERCALWGGGELALRATEIDEPLRTLFALFLRDLTAPAAASSTATDSPFGGESAALRAVLERLRKFAASELPVLILGENGTGKELAAVEIHRASSRRKGPWVPVNCAGLSETLLLSELFGHARGAFTGAERERAGVFETGRGGTVFLDEIGDLPLAAQGSLLRVLQEKEIRRLGESLPRKVDARIVAATNRNLEAMVEQGTFRQDLYFRLKVATVTLPPLRERTGDVPLLAERFLEGLRARRPELKLTPEARRALAAHSWPGNVRELKHTLEAAAALSDDGVIRPEQLEVHSSASASLGEGDYHRQLEAFRRRLIERALEASEGSLAGAARLLGVTRQYLSQFVKKNGLEVKR